MKQFIIALKSTDFNKSGKTWTTEAIDLYNNKWYTNYSVSRSRYGLNTLEDRRFVGTELIQDATPTVLIEGSTPFAVTNYGEIVKEQDVISYNIFQYDEQSGQYFIFDLIQDSSPFYILDPNSIDLSLYRFIDTTSNIDILNYKRSFYRSWNTRQPNIYSYSL